jgi:hypothetical protein
MDRGFRVSEHFKVFFFYRTIVNILLPVVMNSKLCSMSRFVRYSNSLIMGLKFFAFTNLKWIE